MEDGDERGEEGADARDVGWVEGCEDAAREPGALKALHGLAKAGYLGEVLGEGDEAEGDEAR